MAGMTDNPAVARAVGAVREADIARESWRAASHRYTRAQLHTAGALVSAGVPAAVSLVLQVMPDSGQAAALRWVAVLDHEGRVLCSDPDADGPYPSQMSPQPSVWDEDLVRDVTARLSEAYTIGWACEVLQEFTDPPAELAHLNLLLLDVPAAAALRDAADFDGDRARQWAKQAEPGRWTAPAGQNVFMVVPECAPDLVRAVHATGPESGVTFADWAGDVWSGTSCHGAVHVHVRSAGDGPNASAYLTRAEVPPAGTPVDAVVVWLAALVATLNTAATR
jgi:hypothetical protein